MLCIIGLQTLCSCKLHFNEYFNKSIDLNILSSDDSTWATPVPIPNTEVKPSCADGTALVGE